MSEKVKPFTDEMFRAWKQDYVDANDEVGPLLRRLEAVEAYASKMARKHPTYFLKEFYAWAEASGHLGHDRGREETAGDRAAYNPVEEENHGDVH